MATRVYKEGGFIVVQSDIENLIDVEAFIFSFNGANTILFDQENERTYPIETTELQNQGGAPVGDQSAVDVYLKDLKPASGGGGGTSDTTAANQVILNDQTAAKQIGYVLGLSAEAPPPYSDLTEFIQTLNGNATSYLLDNLVADNTEELAQLFNDLQTDLFYGALSATELYFVPVSVDINDVGVISFEDGGEGVLSFNAPYSETVDVPTGALHQLVTLMQQQIQLARNLVTLNESNIAIASTLNSSTTPLGIGAIFTGTGELNTYPSVKVIPYADQNGILYVEFSNDGINWTTSLQYAYDIAKINPPHTFTKGVRFYRTRFENTSGIAQTAFNIITCFGDFTSLTSSINSTLAQTFDATATRPSDFFSEVAAGKRQGLSDFSKFGSNTNLNGTSRVIASFGATTFTPLSTASTLDIVFSSANDTLAGTGARTITITGVTTGYVEQIETINTNGTSLTTASVWLGINRVSVSTAGTLFTNAGDITITATTGGATQAQMPASTSTTRQLIFFVPIDKDLNIFSYIFNTTKTSGGTPRINILGYIFNNGVKTLAFDAQVDTANASIVTEEFKVPFFIQGGSCYWAEASTSSGSGSITARMQQILIDK